MKLLRSFILLLSLCTANLAQVIQFEFVRDYDFTGRGNDSIIAHKYLYRENEILMVGRRSFRIMDAVTGQIVDDRELDIDEYGEDSSRLISPDNTHMVVFGNYSYNDNNNKRKRPATVWNLGTGLPVAVLDKTRKPVQAAMWSYDGNTLVTSSEPTFLVNLLNVDVEISFWDGQTFELKSTLPSAKINFLYLSDDGKKCLYTTALSQRMFFMIKFTGFRGGPINVFDIEKGMVEAVLAPGSNSLLDATQDITPTRNVKHLAYFAYRDKGGSDRDRRLVIRDLEGPGQTGIDLTLRHEIPPAPKLPGYGLTFSDDGTYLAFDSGKTLKIYDVSSGQVKYELTKDDLPTHWMNNNKVLIYNYGKKLEARDITNGNLLYEYPLIYRQYETEDSIYVDDETIIVPHPDDRIFMTYSKQYLKIYDAITGQLLQTLIKPPLDFNRIDPKKGPQLSSKPILSRAYWSPDGKAIYVIGAEKGSMTLFRVATKSDS